MLQFLMDVYAFFSVAPDANLAIAPLALAALIGAGVGGLKHFAVDKPEADRERRYQSETARWSPWTGLKAQYVKNPSMVGSMLQGGMAGLSFGQGLGGGQSSYSGMIPVDENGVRRVGGYMPQN